MRTFLIALAAAPVLFSGGAAAAQTKGPTSNETELMAVDAAFARDSRTEHERAWGRYAADDAVTEAGAGRAAIVAAYAKVYARPGMVFDWKPDAALISGDFGVTRGRYSIRSDATPASTGSYLTVWRKTAGQWRYVWDGGTEDPAPSH